jgi:hypothetical protein
MGGDDAAFATSVISDSYESAPRRFFTQCQAKNAATSYFYWIFKERSGYCNILTGQY